MLWSQLQPVQFAMEKNVFPFTTFPDLIQLSQAMGMLELDHVLYRTEFFGKTSFSFLNALDSFSLLLATGCLLSISYLMAEQTSKSVLYYVWALFNSLFTSTFVRIKQKFKIASFLYSVWLLFVLIFQQFYDADLLSLLSKPPRPKVIDSLKDLEAYPQLILGAFDPAIVHVTDEDIKIVKFLNMTSVSGWNQKNEYLSEFKNEKMFLSLIEYFRQDYSNKLIETRIYRNGEGAVVGLKCYLGYKLSNIKEGFYRVKLHISIESAGVSPYFLLFTMYAEEEERTALNRM